MLLLFHVHCILWAHIRAASPVFESNCHVLCDIKILFIHSFKIIAIQESTTVVYRSTCRNLSICNWRPPVHRKQSHRLLWRDMYNSMGHIMLLQHVVSIHMTQTVYVGQATWKLGVNW